LSKVQGELDELKGIMVKNIGKNFIHFSTSNFPRMCDGGQPDIISVYSEWEKGCICIFFLIFIQQA